MTAPMSGVIPSSTQQPYSTPRARLQTVPSYASSTSALADEERDSGDSAHPSPVKLGIREVGQPDSPAPQIPYGHSSGGQRRISPSNGNSKSGQMSNTGSPNGSRHKNHQHHDQLDVPLINTPPRSHLEAATSHAGITTGKGAVHHPAPHGFLAKMSSLALQESVQQAIDGAGADGVMRDYRINQPPTDRPVRIYADGVYDLVRLALLAVVCSCLQYSSPHLPVSSTTDTLWPFDKQS